MMRVTMTSLCNICVCEPVSDTNIFRVDDSSEVAEIHVRKHENGRNKKRKSEALPNGKKSVSTFQTDVMKSPHTIKISVKTFRLETETGKLRPTQQPIKRSVTGLSSGLN